MPSEGSQLSRTVGFHENDKIRQKDHGFVSQFNLARLPMFSAKERQFRGLACKQTSNVY